MQHEPEDMEPQADVWFDAGAAERSNGDAAPAPGEGVGSCPGGASPPDDANPLVPADEVEEPDFYTQEELDAWAPLPPRPRLPPGDPELLLARAVSDLLFTYRRMHRLTQAQLARRMGVDQARVSRLEQGWRSVSFVMLARVAAATGATVNVELRPERHAAGVRRVTTAVGLHHGAATVTVLGPRPPTAPLSLRWPTAIS